MFTLRVIRKLAPIPEQQQTTRKAAGHYRARLVCSLSAAAEIVLDMDQWATYCGVDARPNNPCYWLHSGSITIAGLSQAILNGRFPTPGMFRLPAAALWAGLLTQAPSVRFQAISSHSCRQETRVHCRFNPRIMNSHIYKYFILSAFFDNINNIIFMEST